MKARFEVIGAKDEVLEIHRAVYAALQGFADVEHPKRFEVDTLTSVTGDTMYTLTVSEI